jgi:flagellar biosynthesis/type III secretory pathway chaperone
MADQASELSRIVRDQVRLYCDLIEHARQKTALLVQGRVDAILESDKTDEALIAKLQALKSEMVRLCRDLNDAFRIPREEFTLVKLAQRLEPSLALELQSQAALFRDMVKRLKSINQRNVRLMENALRYSGGILALISNARGSYSPTGLFGPILHLQPKFSQSA